ncbi:flagellar protein [Liquorilactobacillus capillatus]|nr:flagellar protein [Liquorilactobacillus capillatus]AJA33896.1 flagellar operon protein [Liquorilactobacillus capillatus]
MPMTISQVDRTAGTARYHGVSAKKRQTAELFTKVLDEKKQSVKLSNHARKRLDTRKLHLQNDDYQQIGAALTELENKGSRESLLMYKDMGLIANIHNRTIITALNKQEINTVTNIDSIKFIK